LSNYKKAVKLEEGKVQAQMRGLLKWKKSKKGMELSIREHIGKAIDRLNPLDTAVVIAGTMVIKGVIDTSAEVTGKISSLWQQWGAVGMVGLYQPIWQALEVAKQYGLKGVSGVWNEETFKWALAFFLAYILVKHGGQLMGLLDKGITAIALMMLG
jgi:hypothetical protein